MRASLRTIAAAIGLLFVGGTLQAHLHRAFARHGFCTAHGEPIHLNQTPEVGAASRSAAVQRAPAPAHGVHDCAQLSFLTQGVEPADAPPSTLVATRVAPVATSHGQPCRTIPILQLAPKGSPPA